MLLIWRERGGKVGVEETPTIDKLVYACQSPLRRAVTGGLTKDIY